MRLTPRRRLIVDPQVQKTLMVRVITYWCFYVLTIAQLLLAWNILRAPDGPFLNYFRFDELWDKHGPVMVASLVMLPIMLLDVLHFSNRFVGPVYRMRRTLRALAAGEFVVPLKFRKHDFRPELAEEVNAVAAYIESLKRQIAVLSAQQTPAAKNHDAAESAPRPVA